MHETIVGWFLPRNLEARAAWFDPVRYTWKPGDDLNSGLFLRCPAQNLSSDNTFIISSPFDLHLQCTLTDDGCELNVGDKSSIRPEKLANLIKVHPRSEWREADKPLLQIMLNYYFVSDNEVELQYLSPVGTYFFEPALPGLVLQGRWGIRSWIRPINFVFEWWRTSSELRIGRGQPILNIMFAPGEDCLESSTN